MKKISKANQLKDVSISFVSLVDKPANAKPFLITKCEGDKADFSMFCRIIKDIGEQVILPEKETHYVTGIVYEPLTEDLQGDYMTAEEIAKTAYNFMKNWGGADIQHSFEWTQGLDVVESYIAPTDLEIGGENIKKGTWLVTVEITKNSIWEKVKNGEITGFSMGGRGTRYEEEPIEEVTEKSLITKIARIFGIKKEETKLTKEEIKAIGEEVAKNLSKSEPQIALEPEKLTLENITKAFQTAVKDLVKTETETKPITQEEVAALIEKTIKNTVEKQAQLETQPELPTIETVQKMINTALSNAYGVPSTLPGQNVAKSEEHYLKGIL